MTNTKNFKIWFSSNIYLVATAGLQLIGFIVLGRALGALEYGKILAITVFVSLGVEFVGLGCGDALIKKVSTNEKAYPKMIGECIRLCLATLVPVSIVIIALLMYFTDSDTALIGILVVTELFSTRFLALIDHSSIAHKDIVHLNRIKLVFAALRLIVILVAAYLFTISTAWNWVPFQVICTLGMTSTLFIMTVKRYGGISREGVQQLNIKESILFSLTQTSRAIQSNIDKYAVQILFSPLIFSLYAVAGRFLQYSLIPLQAVLRMSYPKFFQAEKKQKNGSFQLAMKLIPVILGASLIPFSFLYFGGFLVEFALGESYNGAAAYMRLLSPIPILLGLQYIFMDLLTALDSHKTRLAISLCHLAGLASYFFVFHHLELEDLVFGFICVNGFFVATYLGAGLLKVLKVKRFEESSL